MTTAGSSEAAADAAATALDAGLPGVGIAMAAALRSLGWFDGAEEEEDVLEGDALSANAICSFSLPIGSSLGANSRLHVREPRGEQFRSALSAEMNVRAGLRGVYVGASS